MENNYPSKYSGEQIDNAVGYYLKESVIWNSRYEYNDSIFCQSDKTPVSPFVLSALPIKAPTFPYVGPDGNRWLKAPDQEGKNWWQCIIRLNSVTGEIVAVSKVVPLTGTDGKDGENATSVGAYIQLDNDSFALPVSEEGKTQIGIDLIDSIQAKLMYSDIQLNIDNSKIVYNTELFEEFSSVVQEDQTVAIQFKIKNNVEFKQVESIVVSLTGTYEQQNYSATKHFKIVPYVSNLSEFYKLRISSDTIYIPNEVVEDNSIQWEQTVNITVVNSKGDIVNPSSINCDIAYFDGQENIIITNNQLVLNTDDVVGQSPLPNPLEIRLIDRANSDLIREVEAIDFVNLPRDGKDGQAGADGEDGVTTIEYIKNPILYPAGEFKINTEYVHTGIKTPYVFYDGMYYYLSSIGTYKSEHIVNNPSTDIFYWSPLENFGAVFTQIGIISNGLIGSAVFNGDYMFSQKGLDNEGEESTNYEKFRTHYSTGELLQDPYDPNAAFTPNYCINFKTGDLRSRAVDKSINDSVATAKSEIITDAGNISMRVQETIMGQLKSAGIDITAEKVKVNGEFEGTMGGTFTGVVKASGLVVLDGDKKPVITFDTYNKDTMGTPPEGSFQPDEGTPVIIINHNGTTYLMSMVQLMHGSGSARQYRQHDATSEQIKVVNKVNATTGDQGSYKYVKITNYPYLEEIYSNGVPTGTTIPAELYDADGNEKIAEGWNIILNKYYEEFPIEVCEGKTDISAGILSFKLKQGVDPVTVNNIYKGVPTVQSVAIIGYFDGDYPGGGGSTTTILGGSDVFYEGVAYVYNKVSIIEGKLVPSTDNIVTSKYTYISRGIVVETEITRYLVSTSGRRYKFSNNEISKTPAESDAFMTYSESSSLIDGAILNKSALLVGKVNVLPGTGFEII